MPRDAKVYGLALDGNRQLVESSLAGENFPTWHWWKSSWTGQAAGVVKNRFHVQSWHGGPA